MQAPLVKTMFVDTLAPGNTQSSADIISNFTNSISSDSCLPFGWVSIIFTDHNENKKCLNIYFSKEFTLFPHWGLVKYIYRSVDRHHWFRSWPVVSSAPSYYPTLELSHCLNKHCPLNPRNKLTSNFNQKCHSKTVSQCILGPFEPMSQTLSMVPQPPGEVWLSGCHNMSNKTNRSSYRKTMSLREKNINSLSQ